MMENAERKPHDMVGTMVVIVGPSGAGKDSLINYIRPHLADRDTVNFVRRVITRPSDAGGEDHQPASMTDFEMLRQRGEFAIHWQAHGLSYGIPASVGHVLANGHTAIANGSRSALDRFASAFPNLLVVNVIATPDVLASRLQSRGRESRQDIEARLRRSNAFSVPADYRSVTIDNSGALHEAGERLLEVITGLDLSGSAATG
ncbi:phosphonate metabolism protein/1,5-bisphosphokinase (PRPP-forming) PhnN [Rhizobium sp. FY34]|uniref:phosphonate metabolism protein/1,5-bisphosphokinase (PRPP-forming) PhnN n=1 Tax=Rhizobium sp. FY34 TaxID=2562309 RepID=UPI001FEEA0DF|nr:phosphonate metabolism protein/1,5-bisphosphokinase (PRPP-forming) PhnN [Rhizobium sp. FY34]